MNSLPFPWQPGRRAFLQRAAAGLTLGGLWLTGCHDDVDDLSRSPRRDVGSGDVGLLNVAYALKQLEAAFYAAAKAGAYYRSLDAASLEKQVLDTLHDHEQIHQALLRQRLGTAALPTLATDFASIDFDRRTTRPGWAQAGVLQAAQTLEDLGVAAYNGAVRFVQNSEVLLLLGKLVAVEARHAATIRELLVVNSFVNSSVVDSATGLERSRRPPVVLETANLLLAPGSRLSADSFVA